MVVDDEPDLVDATQALLEGEGYAVVTAADGAEAYAKALAEKPDLMILDVMMAHGTEGFEVVKKLKANPSTEHLPVIMLTGIRRAKRLPFRFDPDPEWLPVKAVLEKPVKPEDLLRHVREAMGCGALETASPA